jgi:hypothetical protein
MKIVINSLIAVAFLLISIESNADSVTFDFTGRVADATYATTNPLLIPDGNLVYGSFTFTYDPLTSGDGTVSGTIGASSPQGWLATMPKSGPGSVLFSSTVQIAGFATSYSTNDAGIGSSQISGGFTTSIGTNPCGGNSGIPQQAGSVNGCEMSGSGPVGMDSWITLNPTGAVAFSSDGLPDLSDIAFGSGEFVYYTKGATSNIFSQGASGVQYEITSITQAPEINATSAASGLTLLLGGLLVLRGRRRIKA